MPETNRPLKVFLSYASQDKLLVRELSRRLVGEGWIDTWQDEKNLLPGQDWRVKIEEAVEEADVVIIVLSQHSVSKEGHVQKELRYAREIALEKPEDAIFLIPLRLDDCEVPRGLRFYQWVDYFGEKKDSSYNALVASLKLRHEQKLKTEEVDHLLRAKEKREAAEQAAEKARLIAEEEQQRIAKEKVEYEAAKKATREKAEKEAAEKAWLKAEEADRETAEKNAREKAKKEAAEKVRLQAKKKEKRESEKKEEKFLTAKPKVGGQIVYWFGGFIVLILGIILLSSLNSPSSTLQPTPGSTRTESIFTLTQDTVKPSATVIPMSTPTPTSTLTSTPLLTEITDAKGISMVLVPDGKFIMGSDDGDVNEKPVHEVYLDAYYIDAFEVTNSAYKLCVTDGMCELPNDTTTYYNNSRYGDYPVVYVNWNMANSYCEWRAAKLPTEAEWEKAARGTDARTYPWGKAFSCDLSNSLCIGGLSKIGSYEDGKSPYGVYDMAGNVWEWVSSLYKPYPYDENDGREDLNSSGNRVLRGGSWRNGSSYVRTPIRNEGLSFTHDYIGFRCAKDAP